jgi:hypothetical protein
MSDLDYLELSRCVDVCGEVQCTDPKIECFEYEDDYETGTPLCRHCHVQGGRGRCERSPNVAKGAIFLKGNISEGFKALGPYEDHDEAAECNDSEDGWIMGLEKSLQPASAKTSEQIAQENYREADGSLCPNCKECGTISTGSLEGNDSVAWQQCRCTDCGATWADKYVLAGFSDLEVSAKELVPHNHCRECNSRLDDYETEICNKCRKDPI